MIGKRWRVEDMPVNGTQDVAKGDLRGRPRKHVASFLAANTFDDLVRLQFDEDLHQIIRWNVEFSGQFLHFQRFARVIVPSETGDGASGIIAFDRELHRRKVGSARRARNRKYLKAGRALGHTVLHQGPPSFTSEGIRKPARSTRRYERA